MKRLLITFAFVPFVSFGQTDSKELKIIHADNFSNVGDKTTLEGDVAFQIGSVTYHCESVMLDTKEKIVSVQGDVTFVEKGTNAVLTGRQMRYDLKNKSIFFESLAMPANADSSK